MLEGDFDNKQTLTKIFEIKETVPKIIIILKVL